MTQSDHSSTPSIEDPEAVGDALRAAPGLVLGVDFDGTLAPIVTDPDDARLDTAVEEPMAWLADRDDVAVAVVSGRALADLADRVPFDGAVLVGNHGLEVTEDGQRSVDPGAEAAREHLHRAEERLRVRLAHVPGCRIEDKGLTLSVHVRESPAGRIGEVRSVVEKVTAGIDGLRLVDGKAVYEVRPCVEHDKGTAMKDRLAAEPEDWLGLYVGDDTTDEDAFRAIQPEGIGVHVGCDEHTDAAYTLPDQASVAPFLRWVSAALSDV